MKKKKNKTLLIVLLIVCAVLCTAVIGVLGFALLSDLRERPAEIPASEPEGIPSIEMLPEETAEEGAPAEEPPSLPPPEEPAGPSEEILETEEEIAAYWDEKNYPPPEYAFTTEELSLKLPGISRSYRIAWVSDLHMITDHEPGEGVIAEQLRAVQNRYEELPVTADGKVHAEELWDEVVAFLNYGRFDAVIFGGDMIDYCSAANVSRLKEGMERLDPRIRQLYLRADHDYGNWYGGMKFTEARAKDIQAEIDGDLPEDKRLVFGSEEEPELMIIGVNDSTLNMPDEQKEQLLGWAKEAEEKDIPLIACTHVPYASMTDSSLKQLSMKVRNQVYYWNSDGSPGHFIPNANTWEYMQMLYREDTPVNLVLAGHLHASWEGKLNGDLKQHIFGPAFDGHLGVISVIPD